MNIVVLLLILLILGAFGGGFVGWYPHSYGFGGRIGNRDPANFAGDRATLTETVQ